jgi:hypothetical protein
MSENEKRESDLQPPEINEGDEIHVIDSSDVEVVQSDLTVIVPEPGGKNQQLIIEEGCDSDLIAGSVCEAMKIPPDNPEWKGFKGWIEEEIETKSKKETYGTGELPVPTGFLKHLGFPEEVHPKILIRKTEETTTKIIRRYKPEKSKDTSKSDGNAKQ